MTDYRRLMMIVPAAHRDNANLILFALDRGPDNLSEPASATGNAPFTHYYGSDGSATEELSNLLGLLPDNNGTLPEISGTWGEEYTHDGITMTLPNAGLAKAACAVMQIHKGSVNVNALEQRDGILEGMNLQKYEPEF